MAAMGALRSSRGADSPPRTLVSGQIRRPPTRSTPFRTRAIFWPSPLCRRRTGGSRCLPPRPEEDEPLRFNPSCGPIAARCHRVYEKLGTENWVHSFCVADLPLTPAERFATLFRERPRWEWKDLQPFIRNLCVPGASSEGLLSSTQEEHNQMLMLQRVDLDNQSR